MLINKAIETAAKAHDGQVDKAGEAYIFHPLRVMLNVMGGEMSNAPPFFTTLWKTAG